MSFNVRRLVALPVYLLCFVLFSTTFCYGDSITSIPRDTVVTIRHELDIPANSNYVILGHRFTDRLLNALLQPYNERWDYYSYYRYRDWIYENYENTYRECIESYRRYVTTGGGSSNSSNQNYYVDGNNNTIINNNINSNSGGGSSSSYQTYSYVAPNNCIPPEYTMTALVLKDSDRERLIAGGKKFKVKNVKVRRNGIFNEVTIRLQHKVVKAIVVLTTHDPKQISVAALDSSGGGGFLNAFHDALLGIAGSNLEIDEPEPEYIE